MIAANIPWYKLQVPKFKCFLEKYTNKNIPDESTMRKNYLQPCYIQAIEHIRKSLDDFFIWIVFDETTNINGHFVANLLVGTLNCDKLSHPFLIACKQLEKTNHSTITRFVNDGLKILWPGGGCDEKVLLMLSDAAPYMIKAAGILEILYPNMIHVTCAAHMLQRIAEKVRELYPDINTLVNNLKKVFLKSPSRVDIYKDTLPSTPLPLEPILTRWGTWIDAACFCADHFEELKDIMHKLKDNSVISIQKCTRMLDKESVKNELTFIKTHFFILVNSIKQLEKANLSLHDSLNIVHKVILAMENIHGRIEAEIKTKVSQLIIKSTGLQKLKQLSSILSGESEGELPSNFTSTMAVGMKYAQITSVDVERSFSKYKLILTERRTNMSSEHMEQYIQGHIT